MKQYIKFFDVRSFEQCLNGYIEQNSVKVVSITPLLDGSHCVNTNTKGFYVLFEKL